MGLTAEHLIEELGLRPHPEGGHYAEIFRSPARVVTRGAVDRSASTAIYFLLRSGEYSAFHRVRSDEAWHHYLGAPLRLELVHPNGERERILLGPDIAGGQRPVAIVPADVWQSAEPVGGTGQFTLCGCTVAPGFEFADFELAAPGQLSRAFPEHASWIERFAPRAR